jgi:hypothetical protein
MIKVLFTTVLIASIAVGAAAQGPAKAVYFEIGGPGIASFNYDKRFTKSEKGFGGRLGFGGFSIGPKTDRTTAIFLPAGLNYLLGKDDRNYFEIGAGVTGVFINNPFSYDNEMFKSSFGHLNIGYRLQPKNGGFFLKTAITPVFGKNFFWPYYGGLSLGYKL